MEKLKAELRLLAQDDKGSAAAKDQVVDAFLDILGIYLTPIAIQSFSGWEIRQLMIKFLGEVDMTSLQEAAAALVLHIGFLPTPRQLPDITVDADNVVSIFTRR